MQIDVLLGHVRTGRRVVLDAQRGLAHEVQRFFETIDGHGNGDLRGLTIAFDECAAGNQVTTHISGNARQTEDRNVDIFDRGRQLRVLDNAPVDCGGGRGVAGGRVGFWRRGRRRGRTSTKRCARRCGGCSGGRKCGARGRGWRSAGCSPTGARSQRQYHEARHERNRDLRPHQMNEMVRHVFSSFRNDAPV